MAEPTPSSAQSSPEQAQLGPTAEGSVLLDIGGNIGALIVAVPARMAGAEIELSPLAREHSRTHVAVRERRGHNTSSYAAIFPGLAAGEYSIWDPQHGRVVQVVRVIGGQVTQLDWP